MMIRAQLASLLVGLWLGFSPGAGAGTGDDLYVMGEGITVHREPDSNAEVVVVLEAGRKLKELRREGDWIKGLVYGEIGLDGWVRAGNLGAEPPGAEQADAEEETAAVEEVPDDAEPPEPRQAQFLLQISGVPQPFDGNCRIIRRDGSYDIVDFFGYVPKSYAIDAAAVRCRIDNGSNQPAGLLLVRLRKRGHVIAINQSTSFLGCVRVQSRGPWGAPGGVRCSRVAVPQFD